MPGNGSTPAAAISPAFAAPPRQPRGAQRCWRQAMLVAFSRRPVMIMLAVMACYTDAYPGDWNWDKTKTGPGVWRGVAVSKCCNWDSTAIAKCYATVLDGTSNYQLHHSEDCGKLDPTTNPHTWVQKAFPHATGSAAQFGPIHATHSPGLNPTLDGFVVMGGTGAAGKMWALSSFLQGSNNCAAGASQGRCAQEGGDKLDKGKWLAAPKGNLVSTNGNIRMEVVSDGRVRIIQYPNTQVWQSGAATTGAGTISLTFQSDGNLVLRRDSTVLWETASADQGMDSPARLVMQDDCNLVIYSTLGASVWSSSSSCPGTAPTGRWYEYVGNGVPSSVSSGADISGICFSRAEPNVDRTIFFSVMNGRIYRQSPNDASFIGVSQLGDQAWTDITCQNSNISSGVNTVKLWAVVDQGLSFPFSSSPRVHTPHTHP